MVVGKTCDHVAQTFVSRQMIGGGSPPVYGACFPLPLCYWYCSGGDIRLPGPLLCAPFIWRYVLWRLAFAITSLSVVIALALKPHIGAPAKRLATCPRPASPCKFTSPSQPSTDDKPNIDRPRSPAQDETRDTFLLPSFSSTSPPSLSAFGLGKNNN
jgi:hypothetical protein